MGEHVCIVGAGVSGLVTAKALADRGIDFDWFEKSADIGGLWAYESGERRIYRSLHTNTPSAAMALKGHPMPADMPDYPGHRRVKAYYDAYAERFGLRDRVQLNTKVERAWRQGEGWRVRLSSGEERRYRALVPAVGVQAAPKMPDVPGRFGGPVLHAKDYAAPDDPVDFRGKRVVVAGVGASAADIACELSEVAERVVLAVRSGRWIVPKYLFGRPTESVFGGGESKSDGTRIGVSLPTRWLIATMRLAYPRLFGRPQAFGLPAPATDPGVGPATVTSDLPLKLGAGDIAPKPGVKALEGDAVRFADGSVEAADAVIFCTGYAPSLDFIGAPMPEGAPEAWLAYYRLVLPGLDALYFVGFLDIAGATGPGVEAQAELIADVLAGRLTLPDADTMRAEIAAHEAKRPKAMLTARHTLLVDAGEYRKALAKLRWRLERS